MEQKHDMVATSQRINNVEKDGLPETSLKKPPDIEPQ